MNIWSHRERVKSLFSASVLFPLVFLTIVLVFLTGVLHSNGRRESLAAAAEAIFIEHALKKAVYPAKGDDRVLLVSVDDADFEAGIEPAPSTHHADAHLSEYLKILERILSEGPSKVYLTWNVAAHPNDEGYWLGLIHLLKKMDPQRQTVEIVYSVEVRKELPPLGDIKFLTAADCHYEVNSFCAYFPAWDRWIMQVIFENYWDRQSPWVVSSNLPHIRKSYLLNLPEVKEIRSYSFSDLLLKSSEHVPFKDKIVFIGSNNSQPGVDPGNKTALQKTFTARSPYHNSNLDSFGVPLHVFWAQVSRMFLDGQTVRILPREGTAFVVILVLVLIALSAWQKILGLFFMVFVLLSLASPVLNSYIVTYFRFYIPSFEIIYWGFLGFTALGFIQLSLNSYSQSFAESEVKQASRHHALKSNFIAMISHNLNTPMAQLQGLVDLLESNEAKPIRGVIAHLRQDVQTVLLNSSMDTERVLAKMFSFELLEQELKRGSGQILDRLGIAYDLICSGPKTSKVMVDHKLLAHGLILFGSQLLSPTTEKLLFEINCTPSLVELLVVAQGAGGKNEKEGEMNRRRIMGDSDKFKEENREEFFRQFFKIFAGEIKGDRIIIGGHT